MSPHEKLPAPVFEVRPVHIATLSDDSHGEYLAFQNAMRAESSPDDPPRTLEDHLSRQRHVPPFITLHHWEVREVGDSAAKSSLRGLAELHMTHQKINQTVASFDISVLPERRGAGIARLLLHPIVACATENGRTLLMGGSNSRVPAGERFLSRIGAERGLETHTNQLMLADLDREFLRTYREEGERRGRATAAGEDVTDEIELVRYDSPLPDEILEPLTALFNAVSNDVPMGDLEIDAMQFTPEEVRDMQRIEQEEGGATVFLLARERATAKLVGGTMMMWRKQQPHALHQGITGVLPAFRGKGLARRLKATMLEIILDERPDVRYVRTSNANSNAAMLAVNHALGFRPYRSETTWQVATERVRAYLEDAR